MKNISKLLTILFLFSMICCSNLKRNVKTWDGQSLNWEFSTKLGENFTIRLDGNNTTGYGWKLHQEALSKSLLLPINLPEHGFGDYKSAPAVGDVLGLGGKYDFEFKPLKTGKATIVLHHKRPWGKAVEKELKAIVTITK
jgi:predicted secreted protein